MDNRQPILWHLGASHYSEKVRWALDYKSVSHERRSSMPGSHMPLALWLTHGRQVTLPILELDGRRIADSTQIIAALESHFPEPTLYPTDRDQRRRALELEDWFDENLGPQIRRFAFYELRREPARLDALAAQAVPASLARMRPVLRAYGRAFFGLRYGARREDRALRAREGVLAALDRLEQELDGRDYLVGDRFTVADLTAAALLYPLVLPPEATTVIKQMPEAYERFRTSVQGRRGFQWALEMFRRHRRRATAPDRASATSP